MSARIRVLIVDDHEMVREGLMSMLSSEPGRLLLIVAGRQMIGMLKAGKLSRSVYNR